METVSTKFAQIFRDSIKTKGSLYFTLAWKFGRAEKKAKRNEAERKKMKIIIIIEMV